MEVMKVVKKLLAGMVGFSDDQTKVIVENLKNACPGLEEVVFAYNKISVLKKCQSDPSIDAVLISEYLEMERPYTPLEIDTIDEVRDELIVVPLISDEHKGTDYVKQLHAAAVYCGVFEKDAEFDYVGKVLLHGRGKKDARSYYNIGESISPSLDKTVDPKKINSGVSYIAQGDLNDAVKRAIYIRDTYPVEETRLVFEKLPEGVLSILKGTEELKDFFLGNAGAGLSNDLTSNEKTKTVVREVVKEKEIVKKSYVPKRVSIPVPVPTLTAFGGGKVTYVNNSSKRVAIISTSSGAGSTFVSHNLAGIIKNNELYQPSLIQFPGTNDKLYPRLKERGLLPDNFANVFKNIVDGTAAVAKDNVVDGIRYLLNNRSDFDQWTYLNSMKLLMEQDQVVFLDLGVFYKETDYKSVLKDCSVVIAVLDAKKEQDIEEIRRLKTLIAEREGVKLVFVSNKTQEPCSVIGKDYNNVAILDHTGECDDFSGYELYKSSAGKAVFTKLASLCGFSVAKKKFAVKHLFEPENTKSGAPVLNGTMEVGFLGISRGYGTTYAAIMCAYSLASDYRVAYIELNNHNSIGNFMQMVKNGKDELSVMFPYKGVDFYHRMSYTEFATVYRDDYDYVIMDFGVFEKKNELAEFYRTSKKFVIASACEWNLKKLDTFHDLMEDRDPYGSFVYLFPFMLDKKRMNDVKNICDDNDTVAIPLCKSAFAPSEEIMNAFSMYLKPETKKRKRGRCFGRK